MRLRRVCAFAVASGLAACATHSVPPSAPPPPAAGPPPVSYDWHPLVIIPFGTLLQAIPLVLHEVLLFHDTEQPAGGEEGDCFAISGAPPPQWAGRAPDEYYLCFVHDRLDRIEAAVRLSADGAAVFAAACAQWLESGAPPAPPAPATPSADACEGRDGAIGFRARLSAGGERAAAAGEPAPSVRTLSISIFSVAP